MLCAVVPAYRAHDGASAPATRVAAVGGHAEPGAGIVHQTLRVRVTPTVIHVGDVVHISGSGCMPVALEIDELQAGLPSDQGRGGVQAIGDNSVSMTPFPNGSFAGTITVRQPLQDGPQLLTAVCGSAGSPRSAGEVAVPVVGVSPTLTNLVGRAGDGLGMRLPCDVSDGVDGTILVLSLDVPGTDEPYALRYQPTPPIESEPAGQWVPVQVPASAPLGRFAATADCTTAELGDQADFAHFTVTIVPEQASSPTPIDMPPPLTG
jgi:hypothetical protein